MYSVNAFRRDIVPARFNVNLTLSDIFVYSQQWSMEPFNIKYTHLLITSYVFTVFSFTPDLGLQRAFINGVQNDV